METLETLTRQLRETMELGPAEIEASAAWLMAPEVPGAAKADFLCALADKGETANEIAGFAAAFRRKAVDPHVEAWAAQAIDVVGTGGDHSGGFNISSIVILVLAAAGVPAMKHGNRGITSRCGSADLLAGLGIGIDAPPALAPQALRELGFVFFYAPSYHPAFQHIAPVRKALAARGQRTVFNVLGPLLNPGRPGHILLGVFAEAWVPRLAMALEALGTPAGLAVHGRLSPERGIDELTSASANRVQGVGRLGSIEEDWVPERFGLARSPFADLQGGDLASNLALAGGILEGTAPAGLIDTVVWNAATALWITERVERVEEGIAWARELLASGAVSRKLDEARRFYGVDPKQKKGA